MKIEKDNLIQFSQHHYYLKIYFHLKFDSECCSPDTVEILNEFSCHLFYRHDEGIGIDVILL